MTGCHTFGSRRRALCGCAALLLVLVWVAADASSRRTIVYGGDDSFPPYEYLDASGQPDGFNIRLVRMLAAEAGWSVEIRLRPWSETMAALDRGDVDLAMLAGSDERAERYDLLPQVWTLRQAIFLAENRDDHPERLGDLGGETVAVEARSVMHELLEARPELERPLLLLTPNQREALRAVHAGRATAAAGNSLTLEYFAAADRLGPFTQVPVKALTYQLVTQRGRAAEFAPLAPALERIIADGRFARLVEDRLAGVTANDTWRRYSGYVLAGGSALALLLVAVAGWNWSLRRRVREQTRDLTAIREELERRVQDRTRALEEVNAALERDIERRQAVERALRESEDRLESAMRGAGLHFWDYYVGREEVHPSPTLLVSLGYDPDTCAAEVGHWRALVHPEDLARLDAGFAEHQAGIRPVVAEEYRLRDARGVYQWFALDGRVVERDEAGAPVRLSGTVRNIEDSKRLEAQLLQAQRLEAIGRLAGGVAHDFNNLLTAILGHVELLQQRLAPDDERQDELGEIARAGERAASLTRQMLAFARRQPVVPKVVDLNGVVRNVERLLTRLVGEDIALVISPSRAPALVRIDPGQLEQVLMNLAVNARDAMAGGGRLTVSTDAVEVPGAADAPATLPRGRYVRMVVADTGSGIPAEALPHIFEPFFTTKDIGHGTGLGLATSYGIVAQAGGAITVRSEADGGSEFVVWLPALTADTPVEAARASARAPEASVNGVRGTVLVVEDEAQVRALVVRALESQGYRVLSAASGTEALAMARAHGQPIDLLVSDVVMPGLSGPALVQALRCDRPDLPVLLMSGYSDCKGRGAPDDVPLLHKPFTVAEFTRSVRALLDGART